MSCKNDYPKIELLAPAKNKQCAITAIDFGADAVYIGASEFGARKNAPNSLCDIKEIVQYAHKFNAKIYITINTLLEDDEIPRAKELILELDGIGVDAVILQDMRLVEFCLQNNIEIHASTQCDNRSIEKVTLLEDCGFSRVILARELSLAQIQEIKENSNVELETFIHGALCVSYSGCCYLSETIGNRSANRGDCAQPCRKKYTLVDEEGKVYAKNKHLLSLKDFNASNHIEKLIKIGVTSFKIEGRLKDENYIKNVVGFYRKLIDKFAPKTSSGEILFDFEPNLNKSFNREFCDYFLENRTKNIYNFDSPKALGEKIGTVSKIGDKWFEINPVTSHESPITIHSQDGLCFYIKDELSGCLVNKVEKNKIYPNRMDGIKLGTEIYRNSDSEFEKALNNSKTKRKIRANVQIYSNVIKIVDQDNTQAQIEFEFNELAQNQEKMKETIITQLKKSGQSDYLIEEVEINIAELPFLPVSTINQLRRDLFEKLNAQRLKNYKRTKINPQPAKIAQNPTRENPKIVMTTKHCLKYSFDMCPKNRHAEPFSCHAELATCHAELVSASHQQPNQNKKLYLIDEKGKRWALNFDCKNCQMEILK